MRDHLNDIAPRRVAVLDPVKLIIENYPAESEETCSPPNHPQKPELGTRPVPFSRELWIEREDFMEEPSKGFFRLSPPRTDAAGVAQPGSKSRLKYGYVIECVGCEKDASGQVTAVLATLIPGT
jgi:glutaminyl-tRNA synthetase